MLKDYPGRVIGIGADENENIAGVYRVTGRSPTSQYRMARRHTKVPLIVEMLLHIPSHVPPEKAEEIRKEQMKNVANIQYPAFMVDPDMDFIAGSNGRHSSLLYSSYIIGDHEFSLKDAMEYALASWGAEVDGTDPENGEKIAQTPRIASAADLARNAALGIVTKEGEILVVEHKIDDLRINPGVFQMVSTYVGREGTDDLVTPVVPEDAFFELNLPGKGAEELAQAAYEDMFANSGPDEVGMGAPPEELEQNLTVSAVAVVEKPGGFDIAIRNKWETD
ncbi:MAG: hypothetical protein ISS36_02880 [Candidatus Aenigmarchaeota archaeon]|nr:hypothetical protein [Candidatus Aenigmarchaeota archaeon]